MDSSFSNQNSPNSILGVGVFRAASIHARAVLNVVRPAALYGNFPGWGAPVAGMLFWLLIAFLGAKFGRFAGMMK